jgi:uncharacterized protein
MVNEMEALLQRGKSSLTRGCCPTSSARRVTDKMQTASDIPPVISNWQTHTPVDAGERIETLDALRGFALFGILAVNIAGFSWPYEYRLWQQGFWDSQADAVVDGIIRFLAEGKFYPLFCFLFGLGTAIQMERADFSVTPFAGRFRRRLLALLAFGLAHAVLLWDGDILVWYALCGFLLLPFRRCGLKTILFWAIACLSIPALLTVLFWALLAGLSLVPDISTIIQKGLDDYYGTYDEQREAIEEIIRVFASGSYAEIFRERLGNVIYMWLAGAFFFPGLLGLFLLGLYAGKRRIFQNMEAHIGFLRRVLIWGMAIGMPISLFHAISVTVSDRTDPRFFWLLGEALNTLGGPAQSLAYAAGLTFLLRREWWRRWLRFLAATGRMALSNYLLQSLICTTIFYSYGFGLFGSVGRAAGLGLAVAIYLAQAGLSVWWAARFRFGPMEWLWRTWTYGKRQPMRW